MAFGVVTLLGTYPPRRCGIATFTEDLAEALASTGLAAAVRVVALNDGEPRAYPSRVAAAIAQDDLAAYEAAADTLNAEGCDILCVQHEFGIFGGPDGSYVLAMLRRVRARVVTTLHTVLERFTPGQMRVIEELAALSTTLVVMSERAVDFLVAQEIARVKIVIVPHGIPSIPADSAAAKARMDLQGRALVLTFGLLSPNKGIETAIRALPALVRQRPDALYLVRGATHPHIRAQHGEAYRDSLVALAAELGLATNVRFDDTYCDLEEITRVLAAADVCLLPYRSREQITSGTLAYAVGNGKPVVSTPFWHAEELLGDGRGVLTPFGDQAAMGAALCDLFSDGDLRRALARRAGEYGARMRWPVVARSYGEVFVTAPAVLPQLRVQLPSAKLDHLVAMTDDTGVLQHAAGTVPNLHEGYTTDDNARALHLATLLRTHPEAPSIIRRTLAFLHYAQDPKTRRFRNFMGFDRRWIDDDGGDNVQARAVRALVAASGALDGGLGATAREMLGRALPALDGLTAPRAQAIALVALADSAARAEPSPDLLDKAERFAANLLRLHAASATPDWFWFEGSLSYSNAKLPHGLIAYGRIFARPDALAVGLDALRWLERQQTAADGSLLPVGCERVFGRGEARVIWDGQPVEVYATVSATLEAHRATGDLVWLHAARRALDWLFGRNALRRSLYDPETGGCRDGLQRDRVNTNQGAESTLALWLALTEYERAARPAVTSRPALGG